MSRQEDQKLLAELLAEEALKDEEREAFQDMAARLMGGQHALTQKQREWVARRHADFHPVYENAFSAGRVPRGREVETPAALLNLPKAPPRRCRLCGRLGCAADCL